MPKGAAQWPSKKGRHIAATTHPVGGVPVVPNALGGHKDSLPFEMEHKEIWIGPFSGFVKRNPKKMTERCPKRTDEFVTVISGVNEVRREPKDPA